MAVILGVDPGSRICGYGLINAVGSRLEFIACGCIRMEKLSFPDRLESIHAGLTEIIEKYHPQVAAVEEVFLSNNASSALKLGQARGAAIVACTNSQLEVAEYSARKVKKALVGNGNAQKSQVQHMIMTILSLSSSPQEDAADALSVAVCHAHTQNLLIKMAGVKAGRRGRLMRGSKP